MSSLIEHAKKELELGGLFDKDSDYGGALGHAVMELIEVFSKQGHSGFSAWRVISLFKKVADYECLTPLTGIDGEWNDVSGYGDDPSFQNNRVPSVFKGIDNKPYYLNGIVWINQKGQLFTGTVDGVSSRQYIKKFPFTPKTFYVDVIDTEIAKDNWESHIKDIEQLKPVKEYYDFPDKKIPDNM